MNTPDTFDRMLGDWFATDAAAPAPMGLLDRVATTTVGRTPRPGWLAMIRGHWVGGDRGIAERRSTLRLFAYLPVALLTALLMGATMYVGSQLLAPSPSQRITATGGVFTPTGSTAVPHGRSYASERGFSATLLLDGRVLVAGGPGYGSAPMSSWEVWDPSTGSFDAAGGLARARSDHSATLLADGRVLLAGGWAGGLPTDTAEVWDPATGKASLTGSLSVMRMFHIATLLLDGRVLITSGTDNAYEMLPRGEVWDPETGRFTDLGPLVPSFNGQSATRLQDGRVLLVGGYGHRAFSAGAEIWDPLSETFRSTGPLAAPRAFHTAMLLSDGRVLVVGGDGPDGIIATVEAWDPRTDAFSVVGTYPRTETTQVTLPLPDDTVLLIDETSAKIWDPATGVATPAGTLAETRSAPSATLLSDGRVLVVGGEGPQPPPSPDRCTKSGTTLRACRHVDTSLVTAEVWTQLHLDDHR